MPLSPNVIPSAATRPGGFPSAWRQGWRGPVAGLNPRYALVGKGVGLIAFLATPLWISALLFSGDYDYSSAVVLIPLLVLFNLGLVVIVCRGDTLLRGMMMSGTVLKVAGAGMNLFMSYRVYETNGDGLHYFTVGRDMANAFFSRGEWPLMTPLWSTNLINTMTAYLVLLLGPSMPTLFLLFSFFSLWGMYFFYRAFCLAFPEGNRGAAAATLFLAPSLVYWTSGIGKDAVIALFLGIAAYGFAFVRTRPGPRSYLILAIGLLGVMAVRPHVAAMLAVALLMPYLLGKNVRGVAGALYKVAGLVILVGGSAFLVSQAGDFLKVSDFSKAPTVLEKLSNTTRSGGSAFGETTSLPVRIAMAPFLLFRPLPWEAHNLQSAVAAAEGFALLLIVWRKRNALLSLVRRWRSNPYVLFILLFAIEFCITFSAASSNFGTLSRMRAMLLPFALMLLCAPSAMRAIAAAPRVARPSRAAAGSGVR